MSAAVKVLFDDHMTLKYLANESWFRKVDNKFQRTTFNLKKKLSILSSSKIILQEPALKTVDIKLSYQKKTIKTKRKENATVFGSTQHATSP